MHSVRARTEPTLLTKLSSTLGTLPGARYKIQIAVKKKKKKDGWMNFDDSWFKMCQLHRKTILKTCSSGCLRGTGYKRLNKIRSSCGGERKAFTSSVGLQIPHCLSKWYMIDQAQGASLIAQLVKNLPAIQETPVWFLGWEDLLEKG